MADLSENPAVDDERYRSDPKYREAQKERAREYYWNTIGRERESPCSDILKKRNWRPYGTEREVILPSGDIETCLTFTMGELSELMGRGQNWVVRSVSNGVWPRPDITIAGANGATSRFVYTEQQARELLKVFATHEKSFSYYRASHRKTRTALFNAMTKASDD